MTVLQIIIAVVIIAVWIFRPRLETDFRAGNAKNIVEEFAVYGLPKWSVYAVWNHKDESCNVADFGYLVFFVGTICCARDGHLDGRCCNLSLED